ncbi:MAG: hypothetical protein JJE27_04055 [Thermoleophilia bacterium]|nr:hypothetical protein [Thermoleophilia bacterium]
MSNPVTNQMYEALGRATWAVGKRRMKQRARHMASARYVAIGALVLGVIGIGAIVARAGSST